jgi:hypothetical protein
LGSGSPDQDSRAGSPNIDGNDDEDEDGEESGEDADGDPLRTPVATSAVLSATSTPRGQKRKSMADSITEVSAHERENHIKIARINATAKTERSSQWESIKRHTNMELELAQMQHQHDEAAAPRAHEAAMFDRQAALKLARAGQGGYNSGGPPHSDIHPSLH